MKAHLLPILTTAWFILPGLSAAQLGDVPPELWLSKSAGTWREEDRLGFYRVVVYRVGREHAQDLVEVHIIEATDGRRQLIKTVGIDAPGHSGYVQDVSFTDINDQLMAISLDIEVRGMDGIVLRQVFLITPAGTIRSVAEAQYQDIYE